jgi:membrane associated rhomboid family serine protease
VIILLGTVMTSLQAFKDPQVRDKFILHPWSIVRHGKRHYTLLTSGLIHADAMHLMINLMSYCFFAFMLETIVGHRNFAIIYIGSLLFSSFIVTMKNANNAYYHALGASGAIAGVIFSYILYRPNSKISFMFAPVPIPAPMFAIVYVAYSYFMAKKNYDNIGHDAHLWGAISGALITMILDPASMEFFRGYLNL